MPWSRRRLLELGPSLALVAGCLDRSVESGPTDSPDQPSGSPTPTTGTATPTRSPTGTSLPDESVEFPDGPKERPEKPDDLTAASVREYARTHEYNFVYNRLYYDESTDVELSCEVMWVERPEDFYRVRVSCTGYSNTGGSKPNSTETATVVHADWFTQEFVYLVDEDSTIRRRPGGPETTR